MSFHKYAVALVAFVVVGMFGILLTTMVKLHPHVIAAGSPQPPTVNVNAFRFMFHISFVLHNLHAQHIPNGH